MSKLRRASAKALLPQHGEQLQLLVADKVCGEPTAVAVVAVGMVVRVTNEPWRAREELPPIEGPHR